jgi:hypothetical protein
MRSRQQDGEEIAWPLLQAGAAKVLYWINWRVTSLPADRIRSVYSGLKQNSPGVGGIEAIECNGCRQDGNHAKARGFCLTVEVQEKVGVELLSTNLG